MIHLRTHQLKRKGDYWTIARTFCGMEADRRKNTTTSNEKVNCKECLRLMIMSLDGEVQSLAKRLDNRMDE